MQPRKRQHFSYRGSWRTTDGAWGQRAASRIRMGVGVLAAMGLLALFLSLLLSPLAHSNIHFVAIASHGSADVPPNAYAAGDVEAFDALAPALFVSGWGGQHEPLVWDSLNEPAAVQTLAQRVESVGIGSRDILIVYLNAQGVSDNGKAYLLCENYDAANPTGGRVLVSELLSQLRQLDVRTKLLIIDSGGADTSQGALTNEFPHLLRDAVSHAEGDNGADERLWVLHSHSERESSHVSAGLGQSVFGYFLCRGLMGEADTDAGQTVDVRELTQFVEANVRRWVRESTGGIEAQTPMLLWGGGDNVPVAAGPTIMSVSPLLVDGQTPQPAEKLADRYARSPAAALATTAVALNDRRPKYVSSVLDADAEGESSPPPAAEEPQPAGGETGTADSQPSGNGGEAAADGPSDDAASTADATAATDTNTEADSGAESAAESGGESPAESQSADTESNNDDNNNGGGTQPVGQDGQPEGAEKSAEESSESAKQDGESAKNGDDAAKKQNKATKLDERLAAALAQLWQLRDEVAGGEEMRSNPRDYAPLAWRRFERWLLVADARFRGEMSGDPLKTARELEETARRLAALVDEVPLRPDRYRPNPTDEMVALSPVPPVALNDPRSLALAERLEADGGPKLSRRLSEARDTLDGLIQHGSAGALLDLAGKLPPAAVRFEEFRLARDLAELSADWLVVRQALETCRLGEQAAVYAVSATPWTKDAVDDADRYRLAGQQRLSDAIGSDYESVADRLLREAASRYAAVIADARAVEAAMRVSNELTHRAPYYVRWWRSIDRHQSTPAGGDILRLLGQLGQMADLLEQPQAEQLASLAALTADLQAGQREIETGLESQRLAMFSGPNATAADAWRIERVLHLPLTRAEDRIRLAVAAAQISTDFSERFRTTRSTRRLPELSVFASADYRLLHETAEMEVALAGLAVPRGLGNDDRLDAIDDAWEAFEKVGDKTQGNWTLDDQQTLRSAARRLESVIERAYRESVAQFDRAVRASGDLSDRASRDERMGRLRRLDRAQRLMSGTTRLAEGTPSPWAQLRQAQWFDLIEWQRSRQATARGDASGRQLDSLSSAIDAYRRQAVAIADQPLPATIDPVPLAIDTSPLVSLAVESQRLLNLDVQNLGAADAPAWLIVQYDPLLLAVDALDQATVYHEHQLREEIQRRDGQTIAAALAVDPRQLKLPASQNLSGGATATLRLNVRRLVDEGDTTRLVVRVITPAAATRGNIDIRLPGTREVVLGIEGMPRSWRQRLGKYVLHTFPNQATQYRLTLSNVAAHAKIVDVQLVAARDVDLSRIPRGAITADEADALLAEVADAKNPLHTVEKIELPVGGQLVSVPFAGEAAGGGAPPPPAEAAAPAGAAAPPAADNGNGGADGAVDVSAMPVLTSGLLVVLADATAGTKRIIPVGIEPQRPRRYVQPQVSYDPAKGRVEVRVRPIDAASIPDGGVRVKAEFASPLPGHAESRLSGEIKSPSHLAMLFAEIPAETDRIETLWLHVDGYPRAFTYRVPCWKFNHDIAEDRAVLGIRMVAPRLDTAYRTPVATVPVEFQVDVPVGTAAQPTTRIDVGLDVNLDRELGDEPATRFPGDRQVTTYLGGVDAEGGLTIETRVDDWRAELPVLGVEDARVGVLGRVVVGKSTAWSRSVEIVLDGTGPRVEPRNVRFVPAIATPGVELDVAVVADDARLSGVAGLQMAIDTNGSGAFGMEPAPVDAEEDAAGVWHAKVPTEGMKEGSYRLLVRATDRVGNVGDYSSVALTLHSEAAAQEMAANQLAGAVFYGGAPQAGVEVELVAEQPEAGADPGAVPVEIAPVRTDEQGGFTFEKVPPGKYELVAEGLIRNKIRTARATVTVPPAPTQVPPQRLEVR